MNINDYVIVWDTDKEVIKKGWIRYEITNKKEEEKIYFISFQEDYFPENITDETVNALFQNNAQISIISRERFLCKYDKKIEKRANTYLRKYKKSKLIRKNANIHNEILKRIFIHKIPIGYLFALFNEIINATKLVLNWFVKVFLNASLWLIFGIILRPYIAFHNKLRLENQLKQIKNDYNRNKMIERLLKKENEIDNIDSSIKNIEEEIEKNKQEINDSSNSTIAIFISIISIIISIIALN